jgi:hypothetical protein
MQFHGTFYMYAGANFAAVLWAAFTIPDNRGLSLVKVEQNYETKINKVAMTSRPIFKFQ